MKKRLLVVAAILLVLGGVFGLIYHPVTLTWRASTSSDRGLIYNVYRAHSSCPPIGMPDNNKKIGSTSKLTYTDSSIKLGTFCYSIRASVNGVESMPINSEVVVVPTWRH